MAGAQPSPHQARPHPGEVLDQYRAAVRADILRHWVHEGCEKAVVIDVRIAADGRVVQQSLQTPKADAVCLERAVTALQQASPLPVPSPSIRSRVLSEVFRVTFRPKPQNNTPPSARPEEFSSPPLVVDAISPELGQYLSTVLLRVSQGFPWPATCTGVERVTLHVQVDATGRVQHMSNELPSVPRACVKAIVTRVRSVSPFPPPPGNMRYAARFDGYIEMTISAPSVSHPDESKGDPRRMP
ncbi:MAG: cell envelope integrity protein TolA [Deltaproteobacteria bacterium]|nr:cell envelope integrity protein TolA [Deltaproteobacteria bacterium]